MKLLYSSWLLILVVLFGWNTVSLAQTSTFNYTGSMQTWTVPAGITSVVVDMQGANGGAGGYSTYKQRGGRGGRVQCTMAVTPGQVYYIFVGGIGQSQYGNCCGYVANGGYNGGGAGNYGYEGGGGGGTDIRFGGTALSNRIIVAGGGGGAGYNCSTVDNERGGDGGNTTGESGYYCGSTSTCYVGTGGTQAGGGSSGTCYTQPSGAGSLGQGGSATSYYYAGGGGGGYYGGGSAGSYGSGGGGSSFPATAGGSLTGITHTQGYNLLTSSTSGNGIVSLIGPTVTPTANSISFGNVVVGAMSPATTFSVTGVALTGSPITVTAPSGFLVSLDNSTFSSSVSPVYTAPTLTSTPIYIKFVPTAYSAYTSTLTISGGGQTVPAMMSLTGTGVFPCSGTPSPGTAILTPASGGSGTSFTLVDTTSSIGGVTYQWQSYSFGSGGFTNIAGATNPTYNFTGITNNTYYRVVVTCPYSGSSSISNVVMATLSPAPAACAGTPAAGTITASVTSSCTSPYTSSLSLTSPAVGPDITYNWQVSTTGPGSGFTNISGATNPYYSDTVTGTVWIRDSVTCQSSGRSSYTAPVQLLLNTPPSAITGNTNICIPNATTFSATPSGGTWSSSNTSIVNINSGSGIATGIAPGAATIDYTLPTGCASSTTVAVRNGPTPIIGATSVCAGSTITLSDAVAGGTFSSSNTSAATASASTGVITGVSAGSSNIIYTTPGGCTATLPLTINPVPATVSGTPSVCIGRTRNLSDVTPGGTFSSSNSFTASVGATSGIVTGVASGTANIVYTLPTGCSATMAFTVNALPAPISGTSSVCVGQTTTLSDAGGGTWASSDISTATVNATTGIVTGVAAGTPVISYFLPATGCFSTTTVTVNALPTVNTVTGGGGYCPSAAGVHIGLNGSVTGINYQLYNGTTSTLSAILPGSASALDFGVFSAVGTYSVLATNPATGCSNRMAGVAIVSVNTLPTAYTVTGGGTYCPGTAGVHVTTIGSDIGVSYQLYNGGTMMGAAMAGTGHNLDFGAQTMTGHYYVIATSMSTLCTNTLAGGADINMGIVPSQDTVVGGGAYCAGGTGVGVSLSNSATGVNYQLYNGGTLVNTLPGTAGPLSFGLQTMTGNYTVIATNVSSGCTANMASSVNVSINPLPVPYPLTGGGNFCAGGSGVHVGTSFSVVGTNYQLMLGGTPVTTASGSNAGLDFGLQTTSGTYTVMATNATTGCTDTMFGSVTIGVNILPMIETVSGGGNFCAGGSGVDVNLPTSQSGISYQLYQGSSATGTPVVSTGGMLDFGMQTVPGTYTIVGTNTSTGCTRTMTGSATISVNPLPATYSVTGGGNYCAGDSGTHIMLSGSATGVNYQVYRGGTAVGSVISGTGSGMLDLGLQTVAGVYTVAATNSTTGCRANMGGTATVNILPAPAVYTVTGGGNICAGAAGIPVGLSLSNSGISYQLLNSGSPVGMPLGGTGSSLNFGTEVAGGNYAVLARNATTGCTSNMSNTITIRVNPLPTAFTVSPGGSFCAGSAGVDVTLSGSDTSGVTYQLYNGGTAIGSPISATGGMLDFGYQGMTGNYTVVATSSAGCVNNMSSTAVITANPLPTVFSVTGGGNYCAGSGTGVHIGLSGSSINTNYQVYNSSGPDGIFTAGTGMGIDLGTHSTAGLYTVVATDATTHCTSTMSGTASIVVNPAILPAVAITSGATSGVCAGTNASFTAIPTNGGSSPMYTWSVNGVNMGSGSTFNYVPANGDNVTVVLTSNALCATPTTARNTVSATVNPNETPTIAITANPGANVCPGTSVTYNAATTYAGTAPTYAWKVNGVTVATSPTFTYTPSNGDAVSSALTSNFACRTATFVMSNSVVMTIDAPVVPAFTIAGNNGAIHQGQSLTLTAMVTNVDPSMVTYQWKVNGVIMPGETAATFTRSNFANNDVVCAFATSHNECGNSAATSQCETIMVDANVGVKTVSAAINDVKVIPNPNNGAFTVKGNIGTQNDQEVTLEVTNMLGQVVYTNKVIAHNGVINEQVQLSNSFANGMYLLNVRSGSENSVFHFVIEQ